VTSSRETVVRRVLRVTGHLLLWAALLIVVVEAALRLGARVVAAHGTGGRAGSGQTILCAGDSFTFGIKVKDDEKYPAILERLLDAGSREPRYRVVNVARPGRSSGWVLASLDRWRQRYHPQVMVIMTGWNCNDSDFADYRAHTGRGAGLARIKLGLFLNGFETYRLAKYLVARFESVPTEFVYRRVISMDLYDFRDYQAVALANLARICDRLREEGVPLVLLTYPEARPPENPYTRTEYYHYIFGNGPIGEDDYVFHDRHGRIAINAVIEHVAKSYSVPLADNAAAFQGRPDADVIFPGDHHPNAVGNRIIAETVLATLRRAGLAATDDARATAPTPAAR